MHLVQILLPLSDNDGKPFDATLLSAIRAELVDRFGGLTAYSRAPAEGIWAHDGQKDRDTVMIVEVMTPELDPAWWADFRQRLERQLRQEQLVIRALPMDVL